MTGKLQTFTTDDFPVDRRLRAWREQTKRRYSELNLAVEDPRLFRAKFCRIRLNSLGISWFEVEGSSAQVRRTVDDKLTERLSDAFLLIVQISGEVWGRQDGASVHLGAGDLTLIDATRSWEFTTTGTGANLTISLPSERLLGLVEHPSRFCLKPFAHDVPAVRAFRMVLLGLTQAIESTPEVDWDGYEGIVLTAVANLFPKAEVDPGSMVRRESLKRKLAALVERRLSDPMLVSADLAGELGISVRTVQRIFGETGRSPSQYINERRLLRASEQLQLLPHAKISDVAFSVGFNDLSYFTRLFGKKFGCSPSRYRDMPARRRESSDRLPGDES